MTRERSARERIDAEAANRLISYTSAELSAAADLLADLLEVAARHGVRSDDFAHTTNLPAACLDVVHAKRRRRR